MVTSDRRSQEGSRCHSAGRSPHASCHVALSLRERNARSSRGARGLQADRRVLAPAERAMPCELAWVSERSRGRRDQLVDVNVLLAGLVLHRHGDSLFVRPDTYRAPLYPVTGTTGSRVVSSMLMGHMATASGGRNRRMVPRGMVPSRVCVPQPWLAASRTPRQS